MDGENTTMYPDYLHARSLEYHAHPSRNLIKQLHATIAYDIPAGWRVCGENLYAEHSIKYRNLSSYFLVYSIWNDKNVCLSWDDTVEWTKLLDLQTVPVVYRGPWHEETVKKLYSTSFDGDDCEGYVVRVSEDFHYKNFRTSAAKYVRSGHVTTDQHWLEKEVVPNQLKGSA
jgi:hypothetical protein